MEDAAINLSRAAPCTLSVARPCQAKPQRAATSLLRDGFVLQGVGDTSMQTPFLCRILITLDEFVRKQEEHRKLGARKH